MRSILNEYHNFQSLHALPEIQLQYHVYTQAYIFRIEPFTNMHYMAIGQASK